MEVTLPASRDETNSLRLERGELAGRCYRLEIHICDNPVCTCEEVLLDCFAQTAQPPQSQPPLPVRLQMDLAKRRIANLRALKSDPAGYALAKAVKSEISETNWATLLSCYLEVKQGATLRAYPENIDAEFPPEVLADPSKLVGYYEIFRYGRPTEFSFNAECWVLDDTYCVNPNCPCRAAALAFARFPPGHPAGNPLRPCLFVYYHYQTERIEQYPGGGETPLPGREFLDALKRAHPNLNSVLSERHALLRQLYRRALAKKKSPGRDDPASMGIPAFDPEDQGREKPAMPSRPPLPGLAAPPPTVSQPARRTKIGRNDPCPCGSGKKYKKCCGA